MIAVIFEAIPVKEKQDTYFDIASQLRPELEKIEGFISVERFQSVINPGKFLSLSFWKDEASVAQWRNTEMHRMAQKQGRNKIFEYYRLKVAEVVRDYGKTERDQAPEDSKKVHH